MWIRPVESFRGVKFSPNVLVEFFGNKGTFSLFLTAAHTQTLNDPNGLYGAFSLSTLLYHLEKAANMCYAKKYEIFTEDTVVNLRQKRLQILADLQIVPPFSELLLPV